MGKESRRIARETGIPGGLPSVEVSAKPQGPGVGNVESTEKAGNRDKEIADLSRKHEEACEIANRDAARFHRVTGDLDTTAAALSALCGLPSKLRVEHEEAIRDCAIDVVRWIGDLRDLRGKIEANQFYLEEIRKEGEKLENE